MPSLYLDLDPATLTFTSDRKDQRVVVRLLSDGDGMTKKALVELYCSETGKSEGWAYKEIKRAIREGQITLEPESNMVTVKE